MTELQTSTTGKSRPPSAASDSASAPSHSTSPTEVSQPRAGAPWYKAIFCRVGLHKGPWEYAAEGHCTQTRECSRCGAIKARTKHQCEWRYVSDGRCEQVRPCTWCEVVSGNRIEHSWSESWQEESRWWDGEKRAHRCTRCGDIERWTVNDSD